MTPYRPPRPPRFSYPRSLSDFRAGLRLEEPRWSAAAYFREPPPAAPEYAHDNRKAAPRTKP